MLANDQSTINGYAQSGAQSPLVSQFFDMMCAQRERQLEADDGIRRDILVRLTMVNLVAEVGRVIREAAITLAEAKGTTGAFSTDQNADVLTWQLAEFLVQGTFWRDPDGAPFVRGHQVDAQHAADYFDIISNQKVEIE